MVYFDARDCLSAKKKYRLAITGGQHRKKKERQGGGGRSRELLRLQEHSGGWGTYFLLVMEPNIIKPNADASFLSAVMSLPRTSEVSGALRVGQYA